MQWQQRRMVLNCPFGRNVEKIFRHELCNIGHDAEVRIESTALFPQFRVLEALRLVDWQIMFNRQCLDGIDRPTFSVWRTIDGNDVFTAIKQRLQHRLSEGLLAVNDNTHPSPFRALCPCNRSIPRRQILTSRYPLRSYRSLLEFRPYARPKAATGLHPPESLKV